jgi:ABC-2 type transport system ATP-binding protein
MFILEAKEVIKQYNKHTALDKVSIQVKTGSIFGLLGPNGAGKTTLIRIINQITGPDSGAVLFNGKAIQPNDTELVGYLPEERGLYKKMKVSEQATYLARLKGMTAKEADKKLRFWFEKLEMGGWWNKPVEELSKGMAQKVQFVVTIMHEPSLLILDEPFSGFDPVNANIIKNEILELKQKGTTIIFSTHNMGSVEELCDDIALIHQSKVILDGSVKAVKNAHRTNLFNVSFRGNMLGFTNAMWAGAELINHKTDDDLNFATIKLLGNHTANDLLQAVMPKAEIVSFSEVIPTMNDIFIKCVSKENAMATKSNFTE